MRLVAEADISHEISRDMYESYGWCFHSDASGDVMLQSVEYDWLDDTNDKKVVAKLRKVCNGLKVVEAESIVDVARQVRADMEEVEVLLDRAVNEYVKGSIEGVKDALDKAEMVEKQHGDCPATDRLRSQLLEKSTYLLHLRDNHLREDDFVLDEKPSESEIKGIIEDWIREIVCSVVGGTVDVDYILYENDKTIDCVDSFVSLTVDPVEDTD